jgi:hypothetical protein
MRQQSKVLFRSAWDSGNFFLHFLLFVINIHFRWAKSITFATGQCPVMQYHRQLMNCILYDRIKIADAVNVQVSAFFNFLILFFGVFIYFKIILGHHFGPGPRGIQRFRQRSSEEVLVGPSWDCETVEPMMCFLK